MTEIFVFGSNLLGIHKKGAALNALQEHGAILGQGVGLQGCSYAIPTKYNPRRSLELIQINKYVADFLVYAESTPENTYMVTKIGCGLAGWDPIQIAPMFRWVKYLNNVKLCQEFIHFLPELATFPDITATFSAY